MRFFVTTVIFILCFQNLKASPQSPDYVIYKNDTISIYQLILEGYFQSIGKTDEGRLFGLSFRDNATFSCWRGYQAVYIIENDSLFLKNILSCGELRNDKHAFDVGESDKKIKEIFKDKVVNGRVYVSWYSGSLVFPRGDILRWDGVFSRTYYKEEILKFKKGVLKKAKTVDNYIDLPNGISRALPKDEMYTARYRKAITDTVFSIIKLLNWEKLSDCDCDDKYIIVITKKGKIGNIEPWTNDKKMIKEDVKDHKKCIRLFLKQLKNLQFDIVKWNGKPYKEKLLFEIFYSADDSLENWSPYTDN